MSGVPEPLPRLSTGSGDGAEADEALGCISTLTELSPGLTVRCWLPATTSTSSGGSTARLVVVITGKIAVLSRCAVAASFLDGFGCVSADGATTGLDGAIDVATVAAAVFGLCGGALCPG